MTISPLPLLGASGAGTVWPDDVVDLTDRRRILVLTVLGVDVPGPVADGMFAPGPAQSSSTTSRSGGRAPSTDAT